MSVKILKNIYLIIKVGYLNNNKYLKLTWKMLLICGQAFGFPPGINDGPYRAPSSPPDTPEPMNNKPFGASALHRR